jgi:hypothetical protein
MYHGLFRRNLPELWKLHDNIDLNEKAVYILSLQDMHSGSTPSGGTLTASRVIDDSRNWLEFPPIKQLLLEYICTSYQLLVLKQATKKQHKLYAKLVSDFHDVAKANGYSVAKSANDQSILKHLRVFFRYRFQKARKQLQSMKMATESEDQKISLQSLIRQAESVDFANPRPELVVAMAKDADITSNSSYENGRLSHPIMVDKSNVSSFIRNNSGILVQEKDSYHSKGVFRDDTMPPQSTSRKRSASPGPQKYRSSLSEKPKTILREPKIARRSIVSPGSQSIDILSPDIVMYGNMPAKQSVEAVSKNFERSVIEGFAPLKTLELLKTDQTVPRNGITKNCLPFCLLDSTSERVDQVEINTRNALEVSFSD